MLATREVLRKLFVEGINKWKKRLPADTEDQFSHPAFIHRVSDLESDHGNTQKRRPAQHSRSIMQETSWLKIMNVLGRSVTAAVGTNCQEKQVGGGNPDSRWEIRNASQRRQHLTLGLEGWVRVSWVGTEKGIQTEEIFWGGSWDSCSGHLQGNTLPVGRSWI